MVEDPVVGRRFDPPVEAAAYFCVAEATRNLGEPIEVVVAAREDQLQLVMSGTPGVGPPLGHMRDR